LFQVGCLVVAILLGLLYTDKHLNASPVGDSPGPARTASATVAGERRYKSNEQGAVEATEGHSFPQLTVFMLWQDQVLRVALVTLMGGGLIAGGLVALMLGLNNHTLGRDLKTSISPNEERAILVANLVAINIFSVLMGICSDRVNRKSFVLAVSLHKQIPVETSAHKVHYVCCWFAAGSRSLGRGWSVECTLMWSPRKLSPL
jgi:hypothetical protein